MEYLWVQPWKTVQEILIPHERENTKNKTEGERSNGSHNNAGNFPFIPCVKDPQRRESGPWHFYIAIVQTDEATLVHPCVTRGCAQHGWIWTWKTKLHLRRLSLIMRKFTSTYLISIWLTTSWIIHEGEDDAAAYDPSWPGGAGADGLLHIGTLSVNSRLNPPWGNLKTTGGV